MVDLVAPPNSERIKLLLLEMLILSILKGVFYGRENESGCGKKDF